MSPSSPFADYQIGQVLILSITPRHGTTHLPLRTRARIRQLQQPHTLSCCMVVDILEEGESLVHIERGGDSEGSLEAEDTGEGEDCPKTPLFLKLYDRRFSEQLRRDHGIDPWTKETEKEYLDAVRTGEANDFLHDLHTLPNFEDDTGEAWDDEQLEAFLADQAHRLFDAETTVYDTLQDVQGKLVPRLIAGIHLHLSHPEGVEVPPIEGILLQYINGFSLSKVQDHAPRSEWQGIVDQAIAIVQVIGDHGILNRDVRPGNFIVQLDKSGCYRVFMIDFGLARLRGCDESDRDWAKAKLNKDEEGAVGLVMKKRLAREGFELRFENSDRYMEWAGGDDL